MSLLCLVFEVIKVDIIDEYWYFSVLNGLLFEFNLEDNVNTIFGRRG